MLFAVLGVGVVLFGSVMMTSGDVWAGRCGDVETVIIDCGDEEPVCHILNLIVEIMAIGIGITGVIGIIIFGIQYLTAGGNEEKLRKAKRRMLELVIGLALFVLSASLLAWLNPGGLFCGGDNADENNGGGGTAVIEDSIPPEGSEGWLEIVYYNMVG